MIGISLGLRRGKAQAGGFRAALPFTVIPLTALLLNGCVAGPDYQKPGNAALPASYAGAKTAGTAYNDSAIDVTWWRSLGDPLLSELVEQAIGNNQQVASSRAKVKEARALRRIAGLKDEPTIKTVGEAVGAHIGNQDIINSLNNRGKTIGTVAAAFDAKWEIDLFGANEREVEAAQARYEAAVEQVSALLVSITAEVARNYVEMRADQRRIDVIQQEIALRQKQLANVKERARAGLALDYDVARIEADLRSAEARVPQLRASINAAAQRIVVLVGGDAGGLAQRIMTTRKSGPAAPDVVPVGLPSQLLLRRPDVRRAERLMAAATAEIGVATADLFPKVSLTGQLGRRVNSFTDLVASGATGWFIMPDIVLPVFNRDKLHAKVDAAEARAEAAAADYRQTVIQALSEVETALVDYAQEQLRRRDLLKAQERSRSALAQARDLYTRGLRDIIHVISAQRAVSDNEEALIAGETAAMTRLIGLYKALGGGWQGVSGGDPP